MASQFRTAFMAPSGFATTAAPASKATALPGDRKQVAKARASGRPVRETKSEALKKTQAA